MKPLLLTLILFSFLARSQNWIYSFDDAQRLALSTNKPIVIDFWASWCGPCIKMDEEVWKNPELESLLDQFVLLRIDFDSNKLLVTKFGVNAIPTIFISDGNGTVYFSKRGYLNSQGTINLLKENQLNFGFLREASVAFYNNNTAENAHKITFKYLNLSLYANSKTKQKLLSLAKKYLKKSDLLNHKKNKTHTIDKQEHKMLSILHHFYSNKVSKAQKSMKTFVENDIEPRNIRLFYFLKSIENKTDNSQHWHKKLTQIGGGSYYLKLLKKYKEKSRP